MGDQVGTTDEVFGIAKSGRMKSEGDQVETDRKNPGRVVDVWIQVTKRQVRWCYSIVGLDLLFIRLNTVTKHRNALVISSTIGNFIYNENKKTYTFRQLKLPWRVVRLIPW